MLEDGEEYEFSSGGQRWASSRHSPQEAILRAAGVYRPVWSRAFAEAGLRD
jgi:hypothetical protein